MQLPLLKVYALFLFRQSEKTCGILWSVWEFLAFLKGRRLNKYSCERKSWFSMCRYLVWCDKLYIYCKISFFQPTAILRTQFFVQKFNFVLKDGRTQPSNKWISGVTVTEFASVFQTNESLQCMSHRIFTCISN